MRRFVLVAVVGLALVTARGARSTQARAQQCSPSLTSSVNPSLVGQAVTFTGACFTSRGQTTYQWYIQAIVGGQPVTYGAGDIAADGSGAFAFAFTFTEARAYSVGIVEVRNKQANLKGPNVASAVQTVN